MMVADKKMLSEKGVEKTQVLQPGAVECDSKDVVYIVPSPAPLRPLAPG